MFLKLYATLALLADAVVTGLKIADGFGIADIWIPFVMFIGTFLGLIVFHMLLTFVLSYIIGSTKTSDKPSKFCRFWVHGVVEGIMNVGRVRIKVVCEEKIPTDRTFLFVSNHRSNVDPMACMVKLNKYNIAFISKPENFKIPMVGRFITRCCFMAIDRQNARNAMKTIHKATDFVKNGVVSVGVYPEGTRSKTGELLEFKDGVFYIAKKSPCPIVVATIENSENVIKNMPFKSTKVIITIRTVIEPEDFADKSTHEISENIRQIMLDALGK